jgi:hypothetical protein
MDWYGLGSERAVAYRRGTWTLDDHKRELDRALEYGFTAFDDYTAGWFAVLRPVSS